jgi:hypothetical protein
MKSNICETSSRDLAVSSVWSKNFERRLFRPIRPGLDAEDLERIYLPAHPNPRGKNKLLCDSWEEFHVSLTQSARIPATTVFLLHLPWNLLISTPSPSLPLSLWYIRPILSRICHPWLLFPGRICPRSKMWGYFPWWHLEHFPSHPL